MEKLLFTVAVLIISISAKAQVESHVRWSYAAKRVNATEAVVYLKATIADKWHIYSADMKDGGSMRTSFTFTPSKAYAVVGGVIQPKPVAKYDAVAKLHVSYFEDVVVFQQKIKLKSPGAIIVKGQLEFLTCDDHKCLPPEDVNFSIPVK